MHPNVRTAAELDSMSAAEVDALFAASIVTDLDEVPTPFLDRLRADVQASIQSDEASSQR